jgi:hypothetical protein
MGAARFCSAHHDLEEALTTDTELMARIELIEHGHMDDQKRVLERLRAGDLYIVRWTIVQWSATESGPMMEHRLIHAHHANGH